MNPKDYAEDLRVFEGRLARALVRAFEKTRKGSSQSRLAQFMSYGQTRKRLGLGLGKLNPGREADQLLKGSEDALAPAMAIIRDAFLRGARSEAKDITRRTKL